MKFWYLQFVFIKLKRIITRRDKDIRAGYTGYISNTKFTTQYHAREVSICVAHT